MKPITVAEFEQMPEPDRPGKQELLNGEIIQLPPAKYEPHNQIAKGLYHLILKTVALDRVQKEEGYQMPPDNWLVPDVSVMWPDQPLVNGWFQKSPMIAVEVVSPGNTAEELQLKTTTYLQNGAAEVWIVYPRTRQMAVHTKETVRTITDTYICETIPVVVRLAEIPGLTSS